MHLVESGSNGSLARSVGGTSAIPANNATADTLKITMANTETASIAVSAGASAKAVARTANETFNKLGVTVEARLVTGFTGLLLELWSLKLSLRTGCQLKSAQTSPVQI